MAEQLGGDKTASITMAKFARMVPKVTAAARKDLRGPEWSHYTMTTAREKWITIKHFFPIAIDSSPCWCSSS